MKGSEVTENTSVRESAGLPDYRTSIPDGEIDLVDLWLFFWGRRKLFVSSAILFAVIGIAGFEMLYVSKQMVTVRSVIEVQELLLGQTDVTIQYANAFSKRIKHADLPRVASIEEFKPIKSHLMSTSINPIKGTSLIELVTVAPVGLSTEVSRFHVQLTEKIVSELKSSSRELNADLHYQFNELGGGVAQMQDMMEGLKAVVRRNAAVQNLSNQPNQIEINVKMGDLSAQLIETAKGLKVLGLMLRDINPRALDVASISERSIGMKKPIAYSLIIILSIFAGIVVILVDSFASRVKDRVAGRS
jgi:hypothetical protein